MPINSVFGFVVRAYSKVGVSYLILVPYNKDPTIEGTILGSPIFGNSQVGYDYGGLR